MRKILGMAACAVLLSCGTTFGEQFGPWSAPVNLGSTVNSVCNDMHPALSKDGMTLVFSSNRPQNPNLSGCNGNAAASGLHLWVAQRDSLDSPWQKPKPLTMLNLPDNSPYEDHAPNFTTDGHWLLFHSSRLGGCNGGGYRELWAAHRQNKRDDFGWETPINLGCTLNVPAADNAGPNFWQDETTGTLYLYFTRDPLPGGAGTDPAGNGFDIYVSTCNADLDSCIRQQLWTPGVFITEFNSPARDTRTAIRRRDGLEMLISSNRSGTVGGLDLWVATRQSAQDFWSVPLNINQDNLEKCGLLGIDSGSCPVINTTANDSAPAISWDGETMMFFSNRVGGNGGNDLYMSTRQKLNDPQ